MRENQTNLNNNKKLVINDSLYEGEINLSMTRVFETLYHNSINSEEIYGEQQID